MPVTTQLNLIFIKMYPLLLSSIDNTREIFRFVASYMPLVRGCGHHAVLALKRASIATRTLLSQLFFFLYGESSPGIPIHKV